MILVIGKTPPPVGGQSIFLERKIAQLKANNNVIELLPTSLYKNILIAIKILFKKYEFIFCNTLSFPMLLILYISGNIRKVEVVDHNHSRHFNESIKSKFHRLLLTKVYKIYLVDEHLFNNYSESFSNLEVISPFLPPTKQQITKANQNYPPYITNFIAGYKSRVVISAWRFILEGKDELYGLNFFLDNFINHFGGAKDVCLVICIGDPVFNQNLVKDLAQKSSFYSNIIVWNNCNSSWLLFSSNCLYVRPTLTDGNSISIHEAIYFGSKVLASDVVPRPDTCFIYQLNNSDVFCEKMINLVGDLNNINSM